jgi:hypothetical protein
MREPRLEPCGLHEMWVSDPDGTRIVLVQAPGGPFCARRRQEARVTSIPLPAHTRPEAADHQVVFGDQGEKVARWVVAARQIDHGRFRPGTLEAPIMCVRPAFGWRRSSTR